MDYADGQKKPDEKSKARPSRTIYTGLTPPTQWPLSVKPKLIEMLGYCYFYGTSIVGPQFSFIRYKKFISLELFETKDTSLDKDMDKLLDSSLKHGILHFLKGILYNGRGKKVFDGCFKFGKRHGIGIEYFHKGILKRKMVYNGGNPLNPENPENPVNIEEKPNPEKPEEKPNPSEPVKKKKPKDLNFTRKDESFSEPFIGHLKY